MFKNKKVRYILIGVGFLIVLLVIAKRFDWIDSEKAVPVTVEEVQLRDITETVTANGKIKPEIEVIINPDASGEIVDILVKEGEDVKKGQLLAKINPEMYVSNFERMVANLNTQKATLANSKARLAQVEAQFITAEANYNRNKKLWEQKIISDSEWETITSQYKVAKAEVEAAKQSVIAAEYAIKSAEATLKEANDNLTRTSVFAPIDGTVSSLTKEKGERVAGASQFSAGTELMRVANLNLMEVRVNVNENDVIKIKLNDTAIVEVDAYHNQKFKGIVTSISNSAVVGITGSLSADQVTNFEVKIRILPESYSHLIDPNRPNISPFRPGMSATVDIITKSSKNVVSIPIQSVTTRDDQDKDKKISKPTSSSTTNTDEPKKTNVNEYVFVFENDKAVMRKIKTGVQDNMYIEILEGLKVGDQIISGPFSAIAKELKDGNKVKKVDTQTLYQNTNKK